jgi:purine-binding chemotaxis protein CheW
MRSAQTDIGPSNQVTLGCFEVGGRVVALDVGQVREVVRWQVVTPLPKAPALIEGVIDLRGAVVPVVDLAHALDLGKLDATPRARIAVTEIDGLVVGLMVAAAIEVLQVDASAMEDPPPLATHAGYAAARAVVRRAEEEPIIVLSLENLLESVYRSALPAREDAA